jgi:hypothetical protein
MTATARIALRGLRFTASKSCDVKEDIDEELSRDDLLEARPHSLAGGFQ